MAGHPWASLTVDQVRARGGVQWRLHPPEVLGSFVAEMDLGTAPPVHARLRKHLDDHAVGYVTPADKDRLAGACAAWHADAYGWHVEPRQIQVVPDVLKALEVAMLHLTDPARPMVVPVPAYPPFLELARAWGRPVLEVPMARRDGRWTHDLPAIDRALAVGADLVVLCNPHNPTGRVFTEDELVRLSAVVGNHDARVFADEVHAPITYAGNLHLPFAAISEDAALQAITATSASKGWNLAGLKCAQLVLTNPADEKTWARIGTPISHGASVLGVAANTAAYEEGGPWLATVLDQLETNRRALGRMLEAALPRVGYREPEGTFLAWLDCSGWIQAPDVADRLLQAGVAVMSGEHMRSPLRAHIRLNLATPPRILEELVDRMAAVRTSR